MLDWGLAQLMLMDARSSVEKNLEASNWSRAETPLLHASFGQTYFDTLVEGADFWDLERHAVPLSLKDAPAWLNLKRDSTQPAR